MKQIVFEGFSRMWEPFLYLAFSEIHIYIKAAADTETEGQGHQ